MEYYRNFGEAAGDAMAPNIRMAARHAVERAEEQAVRQHGVEVKPEWIPVTDLEVGDSLHGAVGQTLVEKITPHNSGFRIKGSVRGTRVVLWKHEAEKIFASKGWGGVKVSAREELFRRVNFVMADGERANKLIDDLLHEEAEKVRNSPGWDQGEWMDSRDRDYAASLIDPYAK